MREVLAVSRSAEYFTREGLRTLTGLPEPKWQKAIVKELLDNALDAVDELPQKWIELKNAGDELAICDNFGGIPEDALDQLYNFNIYVSDKREFRSCTRGFQGNALKTVIAICYLWGIELVFITAGKEISYRPDKNKINAGIVSFTKSSREINENKGAVILKGLRVDPQELEKLLFVYYLANPDVTFTLNGKTLPAVAPAIKRAGRSHLHWYDLNKFNQLLQAVCAKDPQRSTKAFLQLFSGTQRITSGLEFPQKYKKLADFCAGEQQVAALFKELQGRLQAPRPQILKKQLSGEEALLAIYGNRGRHKYRLICGEYASREARIPFALEGFLLHAPAEREPFRVISAVNNSLPYEDIPFYFEFSSHSKFCGKIYSASSLQRLFDQSDLSEAKGIILYLNFISPFIEFTDKAKTKIIADRFKEELLALLNYLCRDAVKEIQRAKRSKRSFDRSRAMFTVRERSKKELMYACFPEAYKKASGGAYLVTARQIFYVLREMINTAHGKELSQSDYSAFTQHVLTDFFQRQPELEEQILLERRGYFIDPFSNTELPLGTQDVNAFIAQRGENRIYKKIETIYSIPLRYRYGHVLFVEKAGYNSILQQSGFLAQKNIGIMATQGFGTRAAKKLISHFLKEGIKVYALHDCDLPGYLIQKRLAEGSGTYRDSLEVTEIGLTISDVKRLGKEHLAETVTYEKAYSNSLRLLSKEEREFFVADRERHTFRRVEINALTTPELLQFLSEKIPEVHITPAREDLAGYLELVPVEIIKNALHKGLKELITEPEPDRDALASLVLKEIKAGEHWVKTMRRVLAEWEESLTAELAAKYRQLFLKNKETG